MKRYRGLSGLDILVVVLLLGILGAIVVPRFFHLRADAHKANNQGTAAAFSAGIVLLQAKANDDFDKPMPIRIDEADTDYIIFNNLGEPIGYGPEEKRYRLFEHSSEGDIGCAKLFAYLMRGKGLSVVTKADYIQGEKGSYIAMGMRGKVYGGCKYLYLDAQPERGKVYVMYYDANDGDVTVGVEDMPK